MRTHFRDGQYNAYLERRSTISLLNTIIFQCFTWYGWISPTEGLWTEMTQLCLSSHLQIDWMKFMKAKPFSFSFRYADTRSWRNMMSSASMVTQMWSVNSVTTLHSTLGLLFKSERRETWLYFDKYTFTLSSIKLDNTFQIPFSYWLI